MNDKTVSLSISTIIRECSLDPTMAKKHYDYFSLKNRDNIHEAFRYRKFNEDFTNTLMCYRDKEVLVGMIRPNYDEFLLKLSYLLGCPLKGIVQDNEKLTEILEKKWKELESCITPQELLKKFPLIYRDYIKGNEYLRKIQNELQQRKITKEQYMKLEHYFYASALMPSYKKFHQRQVELYRRFIFDRDKLKKIQETSSYNGYLRKNFDIRKITMYVMHEYLCKCENSKDREEIKKYVSLVGRYLSNCPCKNLSVMTDDGIQITYNMLVQRYEHLRKQLLDNSSIVEWVLIPEGRDYSRVRREDPNPRNTLLKLEEIQKLEAMGRRKQVFYESTPYMAKVIGLKRYHGYVGYIYPNGSVLLDREYNPLNPSSAKDNAIYYLRASDFDSLSKCDKKVLKKHPNVKTINHNDSWEARTRVIIDKPETMETLGEAKQLIMRLKERRD